MSTLQHKQVKSQKQHLKILGAGGGPRGRGPRVEKNKYPYKHFPKIHRSFFRKITIDLLYF